MVIQISKRAKFQVKNFDEMLGDRFADFKQLIENHHYKTMWTNAANCFLGLWLISSPFLFEYKSSALTYSDIISGAALIAVEMLSFSPQRAVLRWATPFIGIWLLLAPLIFWSPTPTTFLVDTMVACFIIILSVIVPGRPGTAGIDLPGPDQPPGWTYNPSSWIRRWIGIALALFGFFVSRYLAAHQLGYIGHAWDPFFGDSSDKVLNSVVSRSLPISDAGFGSVAYMLEVLLGFMGGRARWRTAPWTVLLFAALVLPLGITSIALVILQPVVVGAWCGLCIIAAAALLTSAPLAVHELIAVGQFLVAAKNQGKNFWQIFWLGGGITDGGADDPDRKRYSVVQRWIASIQGVTVPWTLAGQIAIGLWLMARPDLMPFGARAANVDHILGALIVTVAAVATAEVTRMVRLVNLPLGLAVLIGGVLVARDIPLLLCSELLSGALLILLSIPRGELIEKYAGWDKYIC